MNLRRRATVALMLAGAVLAGTSAARAQVHSPPLPTPTNNLFVPRPPAPVLPMSVQKDWRWIQGAVFVPTNAVSEAQQWDAYDPVTNDRELHYASVYGMTCVRVFLYYYVYVKKKEEFLRDVEDFLTRADKYHIKVEFVFFDSCWDEPPKNILDLDRVYGLPVYGMHNSRWMRGPGSDVLHQYALYKPSLQAYVQDVVNAHKDDPRIAFWETYNEPDAKSDATTQLMSDARDWIHQTGSTLPVTATGDDFKGYAYSDFYTWHQYSANYALHQVPVYSLCTECMDRGNQSVPGVISHFKGKVGYIMWEFGIGRDNCRFSWDQSGDKLAKFENTAPFHGIVYPDGHPWSVDDVRALLGAGGFAKAPLFNVQYFLDPTFTTQAKLSVTPMIDFDLNAERGTNVPDSSLRMDDTNWSIRWTGNIAAPQDGTYTFTIDGDNDVKMMVNERTIIDKTAPERGIASGTATLSAGKPVPVEIDYVHKTGLSSLHVDWSGPGVEKQPLTPVPR